jgi:phosphomannomutase
MCEYKWRVWRGKRGWLL